MRPDLSDILLPFHLSWNVRNVHGGQALVAGGHLRITGSETGRYPIDGWRPHYLEVPSGGRKTDISGRSIHVLGITMKGEGRGQVACPPMGRVLRLPVYADCETGDMDTFRVLVKHWVEISLPDDMPCVCLALKCHGRAYETVEAQSISVLMVWSDSVARIVSLDWCEGPLEDCPTPEWHVQSSPLLTLEAAAAALKGCFRNLDWVSPSFSIFTLPCFLGRVLKGEVEETAFDLWAREWRYEDVSLFERDLHALLGQVEEVFAAGDLVAGDKAGRPEVEEGGLVDGREVLP